MNKDRIYSIAQFLIQVSVAVLPIGAAVSGFIAQQERSISVFYSLGLVWLGLFLIACSVFINLKVVTTKEPSSPAERKRLERNFYLAITPFIIGTLFMVVSPLGYVYNQFLVPPKIALKSTSDIVKLVLTKDNTVETKIVVIANDMPLEDFAHLAVKAIVTDDTCLLVSKIGEQSPIYDNDTWLTEWNVSANISCLPGDYVIIFKVWDGKYMRGHTQVVVKITPWAVDH
jgi:hypothetical protein